MDFIENFSSSFDSKFLLSNEIINIVSGKFLIISGFKKAKSISAREIVLAYKTYKLKLVGENFEIVSLEKSEIKLSGKVTCIEFVY